MTDESTVSISLTVKDGVAALDFYAKALGAKELFRMPMPDGSIAHAEFEVGNTRIYLSGEAPEMNAFAVPEAQQSACSFSVMVENCDSAYKKAVDAGAKSLDEPADYWWGMRSAQVLDPFGFRWHIAHKTEDLSPEELMERAKKFSEAG